MTTQNSNGSDTLMCILSYFGIFALIPYFTKKDDAFINWHSRQGLLITAVAIVISFGLGVLSLVPAVGMVASTLSGLFSLAVLILCVFCIIQACNGRKWAVPGVSSFLEKP